MLNKRVVVILKKSVVLLKLNQVVRGRAVVVYLTSQALFYVLGWPAPILRDHLPDHLLVHALVHLIQRQYAVLNLLLRRQILVRHVVASIDLGLVFVRKFVVDTIIKIKIVVLLILSVDCFRQTPELNCASISKVLF